MEYRSLYFILLLAFLINNCWSEIKVEEHEKSFQNVVYGALDQYKIIYKVTDQNPSLMSDQREKLKTFNENLKKALPPIDQEILLNFLSLEFHDQAKADIAKFEKDFDELLKLVEAGNLQGVNDLKKNTMNISMELQFLLLELYKPLNKNYDLNKRLPACINTSKQNIIHFYYEKVLLPYEMKIAITTSLLRGFGISQSNDAQYQDIMIEDSLPRITAFLGWLEKSLPNAPRQYSNCTVKIEGEQVTKFSPFLQRYLGSRFGEDLSDLKLYLENESDHFWDTALLCMKSSEFKRCRGTLKACDSTQEENFSYCSSPLASDRFFDSVTLQRDSSSVIYPSGSSGNCGNKIKRSIGKRHIPRCHFAWCICESSASDVDRYFSLRNVTADVHENKIVTGLRIKKQNHAIHLQIQQGLLLKSGKIDENTVEWKDLEELDPLNDKFVKEQDYHVVYYNSSSVYVSDLDANKDSKLANHVVTGVRFRTIQHANQSIRDIVLDVQVTPYNSEYELSTESSVWLSHADSKAFNDNSHLKIPITVSSWKLDVGQSVFPVFSGLDVAPKPAAPLSGVGLFLMGASVNKKEKKLLYDVSYLNQYPVSLNVFTHNTEL